MWVREWRDRVNLLVSDATALMSFPRRRESVRCVREWRDRVSLLVSDATALMSFPRRRESVQCVREWRDRVREAWRVWEWRKAWRACGNDVMWVWE